MLKDRASSGDSRIGAEIEAGRHDFKSLEGYMVRKRDAQPRKSGHQELFENVVNRTVF
jgi:xylose isomerase